MTRTCSRLALVLPALAAVFATVLSSQTASAPLLLRNPSLSQDKIAFRYADDIWTVSRQGGDAERLTSNGQVNAGPIYSPDGAWIAYSAHLRSNTDVYVVPSTGGIPRRLTWHPDGSIVVGWSPDGKDVLIAGGQASFRHFDRLFRIHIDGSGSPESLPLPSGSEGSFSPDGQSIAYQPVTKWQPAWKRYVGGQTTPIWIVNLKTLDLVKVPRENSKDSNPVWAGNSIYSSPTAADPSRCSYDATTQQVAKAVPNHGFDLKSLQAGPGGLVDEQFGSFPFSIPTKTDRIVSIQIHGELPNLEPHRANLPRKKFTTPPSRPRSPRCF